MGELPIQFPRLTPDDARQFADKARNLVELMSAERDKVAYARDTGEMIQSIIYMLWGGQRRDLIKDIAACATESLLRAIADACPESEIVTPREGN